MTTVEVLLMQEACIFSILPLFGEERCCKVIHCCWVFLGLPPHHLLLFTVYEELI